jgi:hypothetical protein
MKARTIIGIVIGGAIFLAVAGFGIWELVR